MASHDLDSTQKRFAHLHQHTQYSLLDGAAKIKDLLKWVKHVSPDEPACAITDHGNMYGAVAFYNYATAMEVKPIVGYEAYVTSGSRKDRKRGEDNEKSIFHLTLLAQNFEGYQNLCRLSSLAYLEGYYYKPRIDHELIETYHKGIIAFSGCLGAEVPQLILKDQLTEARARLEWYLKIFKDNYFIEIQNHGLKEQQQVNEILRAWARELGVGMVATNDGHYVTKDDARAHETLLAIQTKVTLADENRFRFPCDEFYVKDLKEMQEALPQDVWGDEPFDNTMNIARMCNLELPVGKRRVYQMPQLPIPEGRTMSEELRLQTYQGLLKRYSCLTLDWIRDYVKRSFSVLSDLPRYFSPGSSSADAQDPTTLNLQCLGLDLDLDAMGTDDLLFWLAKLGSDMEVLGKNAGYKYTQYPALDELERESSDLALEVMRRAEYELAVINTMGFPDYFLIVADYINWAKEHGIAVGPGRGCLSGEVPIVTGDGTTCPISQIRAGDRVRSHTGRALPVTAVHRYAIDETLVRLRCHCGDGIGVTLTADHKVFAQKNTHLNTPQSFSKASIESLAWLPAGELRPGDWVFVPRPEIEENAEMTGVFEEFCECVGPTKVAAFGRGGNAQMAVERTSVSRQVLPKCEAFYRFLGRWMANGWMSDPGGLGVSFGPEDAQGIQETAAFLRALGLEPQLQSENENSARLTVQDRSLCAYWQTLFPNGKKAVPDFVFHLSEEDILEVLSGYGLRSGAWTVAVTSRTLADQVRFLLWRCSIPASLRQEEGRFILTIAQKGLPSLGEPEKGTEVWKKVSGGILLQLLDVTQVSGVKEVFDLTVAEDHTYQTSSFAVHNSGAGSIVAYAVRITNLDPLTFGLLFERFLNPDRVSMPDFDIDFSDSRREEVIQYVREKYGDDRVAQIATFGSLSSRAVLKDVARVMGIPHKDADQVSKLIPVKFGKAYTLEQAKQAVPDIQQALDQHPTLAEAYQSAQKLEGLTRHASVHAAGVVIGKTDLTDLVPLMRDPSGGMNVCQYDMKAVEDIGLIKMDFLGLRTLSFLEEAARIVKESKGVDLDFDAIPFDDEATFDLLSRGDNKGVFQLEGTGIADASRRLKPRRLADIIALSALYRPGPMENIPTYIRRHHGTEAVSYEDYPNSEVWLSAILKETYGIPVYQEQIMQIASQVAGYTLGQADLLRRALDAQTPIPTPNGWVKLEDIKVGDEVFGSDGKATKVIEVHDIGISDDVYEVGFSDGSSLIADGDHLWSATSKTQRKLNKNTVSRKSAEVALGLVRSYKELRNQDYTYEEIARLFNIKYPETISRRLKNGSEDRLAQRLEMDMVVTTREMKETLLHGKERNWHIPNPEPIDYPRTKLPLDPYFAGLWIGDGTSRSSTFTTSDQELIEYIRSLGYTVEHKPYEGAKYGYRVSDSNEKGIITQLIKYGVCNRTTGKNIPDQYLRAGIKDRWELLMGIVDADGTVDKKTGRISISSSNKKLAYQYLELARSLGLKAFILESNAILNNKNYGLTWDIGFMCDFYPGKLKRKESAWRGPRMTRSRSVISIQKVSSRRVKCLTVDASDHLFVAGKDYILTHNCMGKKDAKEMQQQRILFVEGSQKNGVPEEEASRLFDLLEAFANYGFNKCLIGSTEIVASDGKRHTIREMFERQEMPMLPSIKGDLIFTLSPVCAVFENGIKSVYEVRTSLGKSIFATQNHPFLTPDGWKNLEDLSAGDEIAGPAILPIKGTKTWPKYRLVLLAWILSEKITFHSSKISVSKYDQGILKDILETISQIERTAPRVFERKDNGAYEIYIRDQNNVHEKSEIEFFLEECAVYTQKDCEKHFPVEIFELDNADLALLVGHYWNGLDGFYEKENSIFYVEVPSKRMASDLQHLLLRFGVVSKVKENKSEPEDHKIYFSVEILEKSKAQFLETIGVHCLAKAHHVKELAQYTIPALSNSAYRFEAKTSHQPTSPSEFSQNFTGDVYWETIESVVPAGEQMTYDLEVADTHNFVANDLIVHNSHSAAYGVISYQTAWLKANHPVEFIAALLTVEHQDSDKVAEYINDAKKMEVVVFPPDIHRSGADFRVVGEKIYFGLLAIKNLGENAVFKILEEREHRGPFRSLADFCCRVDKRLVNSRALEHLIQAGAFDLFGERGQLLASLEEAMEYAAKKHVMAGNGMDSLFGMAEMAPEPKLKEGVPQSTLEKLKFEKEALGLYISGHPLEQYEGVREAASCPISNLESWFESQPKGQGRTKAVLSGMVSGIQKKPTKSGGMMARFLLADETGSIELVAFGKGYERIQEKLQEDIPALVICEIDAQEGSLRSIAEALVRIEDLEGIPQIAYMTLDASSHDMDSYIDLKSVLDEDSGTYRLVLRMEYENMYEVWDVRSTFVSRDGLERVVKMFPWVKASLAYDATSILARFAPKPRWTGPKKITGSA